MAKMLAGGRYGGFGHWRRQAAAWSGDDWRGEKCQKFKRGFATKHEAQEWEREFLMQKRADVTMNFKVFVELYEKDIRPSLKENTWLTKEHIINEKILPYFAKRRLCDISAKDIIAWQNEMRTATSKGGKKLSQTYLKTIHNQMSALFNHAVKYYGLKVNPAATVGNMGKAEYKEMLFWTTDEYTKFANEMMDKPMSYYAFQMLYWCGIRVGELLALTPADFDFKSRTVTISKSYQRLHGEDIITSPKTPKSNRTIKMPKFLCEEIQEYIGMFYHAGENDRIFPITKSYLHHVSLLIDKGFQPLAIADRVGHESVDITYRYAHLFPSKQIEMVNTLDEIWKGDS